MSARAKPDEDALQLLRSSLGTPSTYLTISICYHYET
jgi:hypothetical protein